MSRQEWGHVLDKDDLGPRSFRMRELVVDSLQSLGMDDFAKPHTESNYMAASK